VNENRERIVEDTMNLQFTNSIKTDQDSIH